MILDVPYYSQRKDVLDNNWKSNSCGIVCVKMVLDFYKKDTPKVDDLITEGVSMGGHDKKYGWNHDALTNILRNYGLPCFRQEFKSKTFDFKNSIFNEGQHEEELIDKGIDKIEKVLIEANPIIVSVAKHFKEEDKFHLVVLTGLELEEGVIKGFYYNEPDSEAEKEGKNLFVPMHIFRKYWRKMAIFVEG